MVVGVVVVAMVVLVEVVVVAVVAEWPAVELAELLTATDAPPKIEQVSSSNKKQLYCVGDQREVFSSLIRNSMAPETFPN